VTKIKKIFTNIRILILLVLLLVALIVIHPDPTNKGVTIRTVLRNSSAADAGMKSPLPNDKPMFREVIFEMNGRAISTVDEYYSIAQSLQPDDSLRIKTRAIYDTSGDRRKFLWFKTTREYLLTVKPITRVTILNETEQVTVDKVVAVNVTRNGTTTLVNKTINSTETRNKIRTDIVGAEDIGLKIYDAPVTNLKKGLDLQGGTRVILQPEKSVSDADMEIIMDNLKQRLNVYGLSDIAVRKVTDLSQNQFILIEVAGANEEEVKDLIAKQGKFEAKIGNDTVFRGGQDIKSVCRTPDCSYSVDPRSPCGLGDDQLYHCRFQFSIVLSPESAQRQADLTRDLKVVKENDQDYLNESLLLFLDDELVDTLRIGSDLKGKTTTDIAISGPGSGPTQQEAIFNSAANMKKLQTILITGSLPVKLTVVKIDTVSPALGTEFVKNVLIMGIFAIIAVALIVVIRYRDVLVAGPIIFTMASEVTLLLGMAALIGWNLDLAAIAGILVAVGTGVDDQVVIVDETKQRGSVELINWKDKIKRAFFIIMGSYLTVVVAMIPLYYAGAGLVRGFAITTFFGVSFGVFVARPAFAAMIEILHRD
jgi:preprotein translocase subunit SecD